MARQVIHLHAQAPPKPAPGKACNGCGVCCAWQPCPVGMLISRRWQGPCAMLRWNDDAARYHCGLLAETAGALPWVPAWLRRAATRLARRWISAGSGCDSELEVASTAATR